MSQGVGIVRLWWNGTQYDVLKGASLRLPALRNVAVPAGYKLNRSQEFQGGEIRATVMVLAGMSLATFSPGAEGELQIQSDTGQTWVFPDAFILDAPTLTDDGGKAPVTWNASSYSELLS